MATEHTRITDPTTSVPHHSDCAQDPEGADHQERAEAAGQEALGDPRPVFDRATTTATTVIDRVDGTTAGRPSPCTGWDAADVARHLVAVVDRVRAVGAGEDPSHLPLLRTDLDLTTLGAGWRASVSAAARPWSNDESLSRAVIVPWATMPGALALAIYTAEVHVHTWDLATAIGWRPSWIEEDVALSLQVVTRGIPAEPRGGEVPFGPVVPVARDASIADRLAAWMGRTV